MAYKQIKAFDIKKMGTTKNFCLRNVRLGFGVGSKWANAKQAMQENRQKGALHSLANIPKNVQVPVYTANGVWGHVMAYDKGTYYSDGKKVGKPNASYQWGEWLNGVRIVEWQSSAEPKPADNSIKVGDTVIVNGRGTGNSKGGGGWTKSFSNRKMKVVAIQNGKFGCNQYNRNGGITGWWNLASIKKA